MLNTDQGMDPQTWFKIHTNVSDFLKVSPKTIQTLFFFSYNFCDVHKISQHSDFLLSFFQIVNEWPDFTVATKLQNVFKSLYAFWLLCQEVETFIWIPKHVQRSIPWSPFNIKELTLVKWSITTWSFMWWCQIINWLNIFENFPSSLDNLKMAYIPWLQECSSLFQFVVFCWTNLLISARQTKKK